MMRNQVRESRAVSWMMFILLGYSLCVLATGRVPIAEFFRLFKLYLATAFTMAAVTVIGAIAITLFRSMKLRKPGQSTLFFVLIKSWLNERWTRDRFVSFVWPPLLFAVLMTSFNSFKQLVLGKVPFRYDVTFAQWDKMLFLGNDPWTVTHAILPAPWMTRVVDLTYHSWFLPMTIGVLICAYLPSSTFRLRTQYLLTYIGIWIGIGTVLAYVFPSAGPCFYNDFVGQSDSFAQLMARLQVVGGAYEQGSLGFLASQDYLRQTHGAQNLIIGGGISAMPSVHNALAVLFAIAAFQVNRRAGWLMSVYAVVIWIGSIHLGWHYAVDGILAAVVTLGLWHGAGKVVDLIDREPDQATQPAMA
jgi:hypothetical protein